MLGATLPIPPEVLEPPDAFASRGFDRHQAALVLDQHLRRLAGQDARSRLALGQLAVLFLRRRGREALGFARVDDYARERLGISGRELESLANVARHLGRLPEIAVAFQRGELSWTHVRLLAPVVNPDSQARWLSLARGRTVRALESLVRQGGGAVAVDEPTAPFALSCPRRVARLWQYATELARRMAGASLGRGDAAEAIAAEGLSARPARVDAWCRSALHP